MMRADRAEQQGGNRIAMSLQQNGPEETSMPHPFERSHSIVIAAKPEAVFDYVTNP